MTSLVNSGSKRTSGFSIDSLLGNSINKARSPSPVSSVSSCESLDNYQKRKNQNCNETEEKGHEKNLNGCNSCHEDEVDENIFANGIYSSNIHDFSQKHDVCFQQVGNGLLERIHTGPPFHPYQVDANLLRHSAQINSALSLLHQGHVLGHPMTWQARFGNHLSPRISGSEAPLLLPHFRKPKRIRTAFAPSQLLRLEHVFEKNHYVVGQERKDLASGLGLSETQVKVWFQNRRTKYKRVKSEEEMTRTFARNIRENKGQAYMNPIYNEIITTGRPSAMESWRISKKDYATPKEHCDSDDDLDI